MKLINLRAAPLNPLFHKELAVNQTRASGGHCGAVKRAPVKMIRNPGIGVLSQSLTALLINLVEKMYGVDRIIYFTTNEGTKPFTKKVAISQAAAISAKLIDVINSVKAKEIAVLDSRCIVVCV